MPFYLRTGKRLARKLTEIAVILKPVPHIAFQSSGSVGIQANQIVFTLQPDEGCRSPSGPRSPARGCASARSTWSSATGPRSCRSRPEAYERLILDAMRGDATLFTRNDEIEALWGIIDPILDAWEQDHRVADPASTRRAPPDPRRLRQLPLTAADLAAAVSEDVWSEQDTDPDAIEAALRELLRSRHAENEALAPARVLNLVVIVDREWKGEIANRLERAGRYHASRTVLCAVEEGRTTLDAVATVSYEDAGRRRLRRDARAGGDRPRPRAPGGPARRSSIRCWSPRCRPSCGHPTATPRR